MPAPAAAALRPSGSWREAVDLRRWLDPDWYRYLRYRVGPGGLLVAAVIALGLLATGGALTMRALAGSNPPAAYVPLVTTVLRRVRVIEHGRTVYRRVPIIKRIYAQPVTLQETRTTYGPSGTRVVTEPVTRYRPVYRREIVRVNGKPVTVARVVTDTRMLTNTQSLTITNEHTNTVVRDQTVMNDRTVIQPQTISQTETVSQTVTNVRTQTLPAETLTVTVTGPTRTEVITTTVDSTVTVEPPTVTVTVTHG